MTLLFIFIINTDNVFIIYKRIKLHLLSESCIISFKKLNSQNNLVYVKIYIILLTQKYFDFFSLHILNNFLIIGVNLLLIICFLHNFQFL